MTVCLDRSNHYAMIQIQDTRIGISQQDLTRIFDSFYGVNSDAYSGLRLRSCNTGGFGLGLTIVLFALLFLALLP